MPARSAAAIRRAVACTSGHVRRTGAFGSPVVIPRDERAAESSNIARNRDMVTEPTVFPEH